MILNASRQTSLGAFYLYGMLQKCIKECRLITETAKLYRACFNKNTVFMNVLVTACAWHHAKMSEAGTCTVGSSYRTKHAIDDAMFGNKSLSTA